MVANTRVFQEDIMPTDQQLRQVNAALERERQHLPFAYDLACNDDGRDVRATQARIDKLNDRRDCIIRQLAGV